ncbi:MAG: T9SS type A sorting domain-containing protein [Calditrichales bacterium]|nr:MAG: T9SS type A sorting domain-containing protein [Calditrichales bacterium]
MNKFLHTSLSVTVLFVLILTGFVFGQDFETGKIAIALNDYGRVRVYAPNFDTYQIDRSSILVASNDSSVFDYKIDAEMVEASRTVDSPTLSDFELYGSFDNAYSGDPPDVLEKVNVYGWSNSGFVVVRLNVTNREASAIENAIVGLEFIPELDGNYGFETIDYLYESGVVAVYSGASTNVGYKFLSSTLTSVKTFDWYTDYHTVDRDYYSWLTYGAFDTSFSSLSSDGTVTVMAGDAENLSSGGSTDLWVGISVGADKAEMLANMDSAVMKYDEIITTSINPVTETIVENFALRQNYPNPFNPQTNISFDLPQAERVSLNVYNLLGQVVATLVNDALKSGSYNYTFDAQNLPSGLYFYTLQAGSFVETRKMMLIK